MTQAYEKIKDLVVDYKEYDGYIAINCPLDGHSDSRPSMFVYEDSDKPDGLGRYWCAGCSRGGTHTYLLKILTGSNFTSSPIKSTSQTFQPHWRQWQERFGSVENLAHYAHENVTKYLRGGWYLQKRKLIDVYEPCLLGMIDIWATFPIFDPNGKIIDIIVRNTKKYGEVKYVIHPDKDRESPYLYVPDWNLVNRSSLVYIVYGLIDALALKLCGLPVITGSTGKSLSAARLQSLGKRFVIIPDKGEEKAARKLSGDLANFTKVLYLPYEDDTKDCDDIRMKYDLEYLKRLILL